MNKIKNTQEVKEIIMYPRAFTKCVIGGDWYKNDLEIVFIPGKCYPDYMEVQDWIEKRIDGEEKNIEDVVKEIRDFLINEYQPVDLKIVNHIRGCNTHFDVDVIG